MEFQRPLFIKDSGLELVGELKSVFSINNASYIYIPYHISEVLDTVNQFISAADYVMELEIS